MSESFNTPDTMSASRRNLLIATGGMGAVGVACVAVPFVSTFAPSEKAKAAGAPVEVDISDLKVGEMKTVEWRGKPVWILKRSPEMIASLSGAKDTLADPDSKRNQADLTPKYAQNEHRSYAEHKDVLVAVGICSHLGCSPTAKLQGGDVNLPAIGGFLCPCHGSTFDMAGRVYKNKPAPDNLQVPPHKYLTATKILVGEDEFTA
jgi:ubiquinol-cytochrome c reductase iron-sulfur subunit